MLHRTAAIQPRTATPVPDADSASVLRSRDGPPINPRRGPPAAHNANNERQQQDPSGLQRKNPQSPATRSRSRVVVQVGGGQRRGAGRGGDQEGVGAGAGAGPGPRVRGVGVGKLRRLLLQTAARAKPAAAAKKGSKSGGGKGRAPSKEKYLLPAGKQPAAPRAGEEDKFMLGSVAAGDGDLFSPFDPFADAELGGGGSAGAAAPKGDVVHLRVQQRNGKKTLTTVQGLSAAYNYARILRDLKRELCCNGVVVDDEELGSVVQLQGDHRKAVAAFLVKAGMVTKANVKVHGS